jgi:hypothetical protein
MYHATGHWFDVAKAKTGGLRRLREGIPGYVAPPNNRTGVFQPEPFRLRQAGGTPAIRPNKQIISFDTSRPARQGMRLRRQVHISPIPR